MTTEKEVVAALEKGDTTVIESYLQTNDINKILTASLHGTQGTLLHYACLLLKPQLIDFLVKRKADVNKVGGSAVNVPNLDKSPPIHWLFSPEGGITKKREGLKLLLEWGAHIDGVDYLGRTAFCHKIVHWDYQEITNLHNDLEELWKNGANSNHRQADGKTPLYLALDRKARLNPAFDLELCRFLVAHGGQTKMPLNINGKIYTTAEYALGLKKHDCYDLLNTPDINLEKKVQELETEVLKLNTQISQQEVRIKVLEGHAKKEVKEEKESPYRYNRRSSF